MTTVSPELTRSTGGCALSNQPHWVVSSVAGSRCTFLPLGNATVCSLGSGGPICGTAWVGDAAGAAGAAGCCARMAVAVTSHAPAMITPAPANAMNPRCFMVSLCPCRNVRTQQMACHSDWRISLKGAPVQNYQTVAPNSNPRGEFASDTPGPAGG